MTTLDARNGHDACAKGLATAHNCDVRFKILKMLILYDVEIKEHPVTIIKVLFKACLI